MRCADYIRLVRISQEGYFNSSFEDISLAGIRKGRGTYVNGRREGTFETYYDNGALTLAGAYHHNVPVGRWHSYHENGLPERIIDFTEGDTLLIYLGDQKGNVLVENGNGDFEGMVGTVQGSVFAQGRILNGKPDGRWKSWAGMNQIYCRERFANGRLVSGVFPNGIGKKRYKVKSYLDNFIVPDYLRSLEFVRRVKCFDGPPYSDPEIIKNISAFDSDFKRFVQSTLLELMIDEGLLADGMNNYSLKIGIHTDDKGDVKTFTDFGAWSNRCNTALKNFIRMNARFQTKQDVFYFHFNVSNTNAMVGYEYVFSHSQAFGF